jgi:dTDP-4-amino-4,6-dideoxygalactose transaminase
VSAVALNPIAPIPFTPTVITPEARHAVSRALESGWVTTSPEVTAFESKLARWVGARYVFGVHSCTPAIEAGAFVATREVVA